MSRDDFDGWKDTLNSIVITALSRVEQRGGPRRTGLSEGDVVQLVIEHGDVSDEALAAIHNERTGEAVKRLTVLRRRRMAARRLQQMRDGLAARFGPAGRRAVDMGVTLLQKKPWPPLPVDAPVEAPVALAPKPRRRSKQQERAAERAELVGRLRKKGLAVAVVAQRAGCSERQAFEILRRAV